MKKKLILTAAFLLSLVPMLLPQYGGGRGVQEISGLINLTCPLGILSLLLFFAGVWMPMESRGLNILVGGLGTLGIVLAEIYRFFTWHVQTITGEMGLELSISLAFPEFYVGLAVSCGMVILYFAVHALLRDQ